MDRSLNIVEKIVSILKKDGSYSFASNYSYRQMFTIVRLRGMQAIHGFFIRYKFKKAGVLIFAGRRIVIEYGYQITTDSNLILEDNVKINALSEKGVTFGRNVTICKDTIITCTGVIANKGIGLTVGNYSAIGAQSFIGAQGGIAIGNDVIMGPGVRIFSENHNFNIRELPIRKQGETRSGVIIEDDCWIGSGATILSGTTIGKGSIIAAGSIVTKSTPEYSVLAGVPAKIIKYR